MSGAAGITQVHGDEKIRRTPQRTVSVRLSAMPSAMAATALSLESAEVPNDGGIGMLQALGFGLLDAEGKQVPFGAVGLESLPRLRQITFCRNFRNAPPYCLR